MKHLYVRLMVVALALLFVRQGIGAQTYLRGQNVSPAFEGWEEDSDGAQYFVFGYMNRNWEEEIDVPAGTDNSIQPGGPDQGQPTHFLPRRNRFAFRVRVPKGFGPKDEMIWTLTTKGKSEKAYATLALDYKVDRMVRASESGALGAGTSDPTIRANKPPTLKVEGPKERTARVGVPLTLAAVATDDGVPKPRRTDEARIRRQTDQPLGAELPRNPAYVPPRQSTVGSETGLRVSWYVYRGAGRVTFDPDQVKVWEDTRAGANSPWAALYRTAPPPPENRWITQVTFDEPGTYVLRCRAADGAIDTDSDVTITVSR
jgi:hypothetical protein